MVQIFDMTPTPSSASMIGNALGQGFSKRMGLAEAERAAQEAQGDPVKLAFSLARANMAAPGLERSLGQIYEQLLARTKANQQAEGLGSAAGGQMPDQVTEPQSTPQPGMTTTSREIVPEAAPVQQAQPEKVKETPKSAKDIDDIANQYIAEVRPDLINPATQYGQIATFDSQVKMDLTPQEEAKVRSNLKDYHPDVQNAIIGRMREGIKNRFIEAQTRYGFDKERQGQINEKWNQFRSNTPQRLSPFLEKYGNEMPRTKELLINKYNQYAGGERVDLTPEQMHTNTMAKLQNDINKLDAMQMIPSMPPFRNAEDVKEYIDTNKAAYKDFDPAFIEALKEDALLNKDMGIEEFHTMMYGDQTNKNILNQLHSYKAPQEYKGEPIQVGGKTIPGAPKYNKNYDEERSDYLSNLSGTLRRLKPEDDLMLARAMVLDNGGTVKDFSEALQQAQQKGLKLSEFQRSQLQEVHMPRRPPIHEYFSEENNRLPLLNKNYKPPQKVFAPLINYLRGKR